MSYAFYKINIWHIVLAVTCLPAGRDDRAIMKDEWTDYILSRDSKSSFLAFAVRFKNNSLTIPNSRFNNCNISFAKVQ